MMRVKGMRDFDADMMKRKDMIISKAEETFSSFNFKKIDTPVLEYFDTLTKEGSGGEEIEKQTYNFYDFSKRRVGLRYDLTVPLARYLSQNTNFSIPQKLQRTGKVWRYEDTKKGRYREFSQCDIDIIGSTDTSADAQILFCAYYALKNIGLTEFTFSINNRKLTDGILNHLKIDESIKIGVMRTIDKIDKLSREKLHKEFEKYNIQKTQADKILSSFEIKGPIKDAIKIIKNKVSFEKNNIAEEGIKELEELSEYLEAYGISNTCECNLCIVRGLDYYTGCVFETTINREKKLGSICSGGRYDKMLGHFMNKEVPCTGISIGVDRLLDYFISKRKEDETQKMNKNAIFIANADAEYKGKSKQLAAKLRKILKSKNTIIETEITERKLANQIKYADREKIRYLIIVGKDIDEAKKVTLKDLEKHTEMQINANLKDIEKLIK
ncbi:MAG: histidine--tRNA ligase [Candidatus Aenigmarchaeota archaeon]|nr:histidine--tRNA ligase [Candidatus Aenigmarchaeota archaeon]